MEGIINMQRIMQFGKRGNLSFFRALPTIAQQRSIHQKVLPRFQISHIENEKYVDEGIGEQPDLQKSIKEKNFKRLFVIECLDGEEGKGALARLLKDFGIPHLEKSATQLIIPHYPESFPQLLGIIAGKVSLEKELPEDEQYMQSMMSPE